MLRIITINLTPLKLCTLLLLIVSTQPVLAEQGYHNAQPDKISQIDRKPHHTPITRLQSLIKDMEIYEHLFDHPKLLKLQDMARRVWEKQTGTKRRIVSWSRNNITRSDNLPKRAPYR